MCTLGFSSDQLSSGPGGIEFKARPERAVLANLYLRTPVRILMRIHQFKATSFDQLIKKTKAVDWALHLPVNCRLAINVTTRKSRLYHSDAIAQRVEPVIMEHLHTHDGFNPASPLEQTLYIRADQDTFTLSIDTTGDILFKRGIKTLVTQAPLRENIAAAMLSWTGLCDDDIVIDPMCGSGTFSIEAAMIKQSVPAGFFRSFAFESLPGFSLKTFDHMKKKAREQFRLIPEPQIFASDIDDAAITALKTNIQGYDFASAIDIREKDFFSLEPEKLCKNKKGVIVLNPPYGKRLGQDRTQKNFYAEIKKKLIADFKGWRLGIILPSQKDMDIMGLRPDLRPVFHGGMDAVVGTKTI